MSTKIYTIAFITVIIIGVSLIFLWLHGQTFSSKIDNYNTDKPLSTIKEKSPSITQTSEVLSGNMASDAIFRAFSKAMWTCFDPSAPELKFVYFPDNIEKNEIFGYVPGWNVMNQYEFLILSNGTAILKSAGDFDSISIDSTGLECYSRNKE